MLIALADPAYTTLTRWILEQCTTVLAKYSATSIAATLLNAFSSSLLFLPYPDVDLEPAHLRDHHRAVRDAQNALPVLLAMQLSPSFSAQEPTEIPVEDDLPPGFKIKGSQAHRKHKRKGSRMKQSIDCTPLKGVCPFIPTSGEEVAFQGETLLLEQKKILEEFEGHLFPFLRSRGCSELWHVGLRIAILNQVLRGPIRL